MQKPESYVKNLYHDLLAFFDSTQAQNTMQELEDLMTAGIQEPESEGVQEHQFEPTPKQELREVMAQAALESPKKLDQTELEQLEHDKFQQTQVEPSLPEQPQAEQTQFTDLDYASSISSQPAFSAPLPPIDSSGQESEDSNLGFKVRRKPVSSSITSLNDTSNSISNIANLSISPHHGEVKFNSQYQSSDIYSTSSRNVEYSIPPEMNGAQQDSKSPDFKFPHANVINVETLENYLRKFPDKLLILDVRHRDLFDAGRFPSHNVVCIEPFFLKNHVNDIELENSLRMSPNQEQVLFQMRDQFELVVFYDNFSASLGQGNQQRTSNQICMQRLVDVIYSNAFSKPLKRSPCLLIGGLEAWIQYAGKDSVWKRHVPTPVVNPPLEMPVAPKHYSDFKTPQLPRGIPSRDGSRKGSVVSVGSRNSVDGSMGMKHGYMVPPQEQTLQILNGIVQPTYSYASTAPVAATSNAMPLTAPPLAAHGHSGQQSGLGYQRMSMPAFPSMSSYNGSPQYVQERARYSQHPMPNEGYNGSIPAQLQQNLNQGIGVLPMPMQIQFYEFATGLVNLGNTCYMNCILQCLVGTTRLAEMFLNGDYQVQLDSRLGYKGHLAHVFARLVRTMYQSAVQCGRGRVSYIAPKEMKYLSGKLSEAFRGYEQQDCHEFLNFILDGLHEDLNMRGNKAPLKALTEREESRREALNVHEASVTEWMRHLLNNESPISRHVQGQYLSRLECRVCGCTSTTYNPFSCLSIPIPGGYHQVALEDCFNLFTQPELLEGDDAWSCPKCKKRQPTVKTMRISRMPDYLIIHLKRFKHNGGIWGSNKLGTYVRYPVSEELDLLPYWLPTQGMQQLQNVKDRPYQSPPFRYKLYGVANHYGTLKGGHYTAYVKRGGAYGWCSFDDTRVRVKVSREEVVNKNAYVLFYQRV